MAQQKMTYDSYGVDRTAVQQVEDQWREAILHGQTGQLQQLLADDYMLIDADGKTHSREEDAKMWQDLKIQSLAMQNTKLTVRIGIAYVISQATLKTDSKKGPVTEEYRFTDILEMRNGKWVATVRHVSKVKKDKAKD